MSDIGNSLEKKENKKKRVIKRLGKEEIHFKSFLIGYVYNEKEKIKKHIIEFIDNDELRK